MSAKIVIHVDGAPPAKDGGLAIRNPSHSHHGHVKLLRASMATAMAGKQPFAGVPLRMDIHHWRKTSRADALNIINGIADILQQRCNTSAYQHSIWVFDDDWYIKEFHYSEEVGEVDRYEVSIEPIAP